MFYRHGACKLPQHANAELVQNVIIRNLIASQPRGAVAFAAPGREPLSYGRLLDLLKRNGLARQLGLVP